MTNWMEITGLSLQIFAGLVLILEQVAPKISSHKIEYWTDLAVSSIAGEGKRRFRIIVLLSLLVLPVTLITFMRGTDTGITLYTIFGVLMFTVIGFDIYGMLLVIIGKKTLRGNIGQHLNSLVQNGKVESVNLAVFFTSSILFVTAVILMIYVHPKDNFVLELFTIYIFSSIFVSTPAILFSFIFMILGGLIRFIYFMALKPSSYYWIAIVASWIAGGGFLLANAIVK